MFRLYGKAPGKSRFGPMDYANGVVVGNLIYATIFSKEEAGKLKSEISALEDINDGWSFEVREIKQKH